MTTPGRTSSRFRITDLLAPEFMARLDALDVLSRKILQGKLQGERRAKRRGQSVEFADHRPYVAGDDLRFVDWNIYGRLDQLFLKLFLAEEDLSVQVLYDASGSVSCGDPPKDQAMRKLAAALGYVALVNNNRVTLGRFADGLTGRAANLRGRRCVHQMAEFLMTGRAGGTTRFEQACRQLAAGRIGSGVAIVISDFLFKEGFETGLRRLIGEKYEVYVMQMLSPQELSPELTGDLRLVDVEDGDAAEITVSGALLGYYKRNLNAYCNELKAFCTRRGAVYTLTSSADPVESLVLNYLRRQGLLR